MGRAGRGRQRPASGGGQRLPGGKAFHAVRRAAAGPRRQGWAARPTAPRAPPGPGLPLPGLRPRGLLGPDPPAAPLARSRPAGPRRRRLVTEQPAHDSPPSSPAARRSPRAKHAGRQPRQMTLTLVLAPPTRHRPQHSSQQPALSLILVWQARRQEERQGGGNFRPLPRTEFVWLPDRKCLEAGRHFCCGQKARFVVGKGCSRRKDLSFTLPPLFPPLQPPLGSPFRVDTPLPGPVLANCQRLVEWGRAERRGGRVRWGWSHRTRGMPAC